MTVVAVTCTAFIKVSKEEAKLRNSWPKLGQNQAINKQAKKKKTD